MAYSARTELKRVEWRCGLSVGVNSMDEEHQLLIGALNLIIEGLDSGHEHSIADRVLRDLFAYVDYHFEHEEDLMATYEYPDMASHCAQHVLFSAELRRLDKELSAGVATVEDLGRFLHEWLVAHILVVDMQLGQFLGTRITRERSPFEYEQLQVWA